jgi:ABC-type polysaccharide/polyol phosphate transport system ATPase subunit
MSDGMSHSSDIVRVDRMNLVFHVDVHRSWTWRDAITRMTRDPAAFLALEKDRLHVAKDLTFTIKRGETVGLMGVNGVGKTSLCRCIAGMYRPNSGSVLVKGRVRAIFSTAIGIQPELTGQENARLLAQLMFPEEKNLDELVKEALDFSDLGKFVDVPYRLYSNGMQARLCLSLISSRPSDFLILDEVFDGADNKFKEKVSVRVLKMVKQSGACMFVSHSPDQVRRICTRLIVLHHSVIAYDGPVEEGLEFLNAIPAAPVGIEN